MWSPAHTSSGTNKQYYVQDYIYNRMKALTRGRELLLLENARLTPTTLVSFNTRLAAPKGVKFVLCFVSHLCWNAKK